MVSHTNWPAYRALNEPIAMKPFKNVFFGRSSFWECSKVLNEFSLIDLIIVKITKHGLKSPNCNNCDSFNQIINEISDSCI